MIVCTRCPVFMSGHIEYAIQVLLVTVWLLWFVARFREMKSCPGTYYIAVVEDPTKQRQVIGTTTLVIEQKFIHSTGKVS